MGPCYETLHSLQSRCGGIFIIIMASNEGMGNYTLLVSRRLFSRWEILLEFPQNVILR